MTDVFDRKLSLVSYSVESEGNGSSAYQKHAGSDTQLWTFKAPYTEGISILLMYSS